MFNELDMVVLNKDVAEADLKNGDIGTVVHCYEGRTIFEVEFVTGRGTTIDVLTLDSGAIRPMGGGEVLHVRELTQAASV